MVCIQSTSPFFAPKTFWCIHKTASQIFPFATAYHVYVPAFGEWGFNLVSSNPIPSKNHHRVKGNKFYDYHFEQLTHFGEDMTAKDIQTNRLDNQIIVRYFDEEWSQL